MKKIFAIFVPVISFILSFVLPNFFEKFFEKIKFDDITEKIISFLIEKRFNFLSMFFLALGVVLLCYVVISYCKSDIIDEYKEKIRRNRFAKKYKNYNFYNDKECNFYIEYTINFVYGKPCCDNIFFNCFILRRKIQLTRNNSLSYCKTCKNNCCWKGCTVSRQLVSEDIDTKLNYEWSQHFLK